MKGFAGFAKMTGLAIALSLAGVQAGSAQEDIANFYRGKTMTIIVGSSAGGGYDLYARTIARYMPKHLLGAPTIVVANMPGAGSNVAAANIANVAAKDGTVMGALFMGLPVEPLFTDVKRRTHDPSKFNYIGNANTDVYVCLVRGDAPVKTFAEAFDKELVLGGTAGGASTRDFPVMLANVLGVKFKVVSGYPGSREMNLAIEKGEVQGGCGQSWSSVYATYKQRIDSGELRVLVQEDTAGYPDLNRQGVPLSVSFAKTPEQKQILDLVYSQTVFGRPYVVAAEVPAPRVAALRKAFMDTMADPELKAEAQKMQLDVDATSGEFLQKKIAEIYATPRDIVEKAKRAIELK